MFPLSMSACVKGTVGSCGGTGRENFDLSEDFVSLLYLLFSLLIIFARDTFLSLSTIMSRNSFLRAPRAFTNFVSSNSPPNESLTSVGSSAFVLRILSISSLLCKGNESPITIVQVKNKTVYPSDIFCMNAVSSSPSS